MDPTRNSRYIGHMLQNLFRRISCAAITQVLSSFEYKFTAAFYILSNIKAQRAITSGNGAGEIAGITAEQHRIAVENNELLAELEALRRQLEERQRQLEEGQRRRQRRMEEQAEQAIENLRQLGGDRQVIRAQAHPQRGQPEAPAPRNHAAAVANQQLLPELPTPSPVRGIREPVAEDAVPFQPPDCNVS